MMNKLLLVFLAIASFSRAETQVVLISSEHFLTDQIGETSPAHLRALLSKIGPQALGLEAPANVPEPFAQLPFEAWNVTKPWAETNRVPVHAVDWLPTNYQQRLGQMVQGLGSGPHAQELVTLEQGLQTKLTALRGFDPMQREPYQDACRAYWNQIREWNGGPTPWDERGEKIAANIERLAAGFDGQRIAVVFGAMHGHDLVDRLAGKSGLKLVPAASFLPLTPAELKAAALPADAVLAMRRLNFPPGAPIVGKLEGIDAALKRLEYTQGMKPTSSYYRARLLMHRGRWQAAEELLAKLSQSAADIRIETSGRPPLALTARCNRAIALNVLSRQPEALEELRIVCSDPSAPADIQQLAGQLRAGMQNTAPE